MSVAIREATSRSVGFREMPVAPEDIFAGSPSVSVRTMKSIRWPGMLKAGRMPGIRLSVMATTHAANSASGMA